MAQATLSTGSRSHLVHVLYREVPFILNIKGPANMPAHDSQLVGTIYLAALAAGFLAAGFLAGALRGFAALAGLVIAVTLLDRV